jgi:DNA-binding response OmpR family regulator
MCGEEEMRLLLVEDDASLRETLSESLRREGFEVIATGDGGEALELARTTQPDLIILDLMLPTLDGLSVCRILRKETDVPILMLTARSGPVDRVVGLEMGADDYVVKPFHMGELLARIRALLRRARGRPATTLTAGDLTLDLLARKAFRGGRELRLTMKEFDLLATLIQHRGPRPEPGLPPGAGVGPGAPGGHPDSRHAHPLASGEDRGGPCASAADRHRAGDRISIRGIGMLELSLALLALLALGGLGFVYRRWQRAEAALRETRWRLREETAEALRFRADLETLAQGGTEALLLLDQERRIRWANRPAMERLGARPGRTLLEATRSPELDALIPPPAPPEGEGMSIRELRWQGRWWQATVWEGPNGYGLALLDITREREAERARRELTANVAHDLRTPAHHHPPAAGRAPAPGSPPPRPGNA